MRKILAITLVLFTSLFALTSCSMPQVERPQANVDNIYDDSTIVNTTNTQIIETYKKVEPACVGIEASLPEGKGIGSGVIYRLKDAKTNGVVTEQTTDIVGYVVTNCHVVDKGLKFKVFIDHDKAYLADLIGKDSKNDLAVLKFNKHYSEEEMQNKKNNDIAFVDVLGNEVNMPQQAAMVLAVGCPLNLGYFNTPTTGLVGQVTKTSITHSAPINPGNSGGGLFDVITGELIGINVSKIVYDTQIDDKGNKVQIPIASLGNAIPVWTVREVIKDIEAQNKDIVRPILGLSLSLVTASLENNNSTMLPADLNSGIVIVKVEENSNASRAKSTVSSVSDGLLIGDVITEINGKKITRVDDIGYIINTSNINDTIHITVRRFVNNISWESYTFDITLL